MKKIITLILLVTAIVSSGIAQVPAVPPTAIVAIENTPSTVNDTVLNTGTSALTDTVYSGPTFGTAIATVSQDSIISLTYAPLSGYIGPDTFYLSVCNGMSCDTILVPVAVLSPTCGTLFNLQSNLDTASLISAGTGYISGNNAFGDLAVAEEFPVANPGSYLTSATLYFGYVSPDTPNYNDIVTIYVWDNTGTGVFGNSAPGNAIDSAQVTMGQIALSVGENKGLLVHFTSTASLQTDSVFVGVVFPSNGSDTIALYTNSAPAGPDGNGWVLGLDPSGDGAYTWNSYNDSYQFGGGSLGNYIKVTICNGLNPNPAASFSETSSSTCTPDVVNVTDASAGPPNPTNWTWIFGDGNTANGASATDTYTAGGSYTITELVASDAGPVVEVFINASQSISVLPSPVVTAFVTEASSDSTAGFAYITVTGGSGHSFATWSTGDFGDTLLTVGAGDGVYTVTVTDQNGCFVVDSVIIGTTGIIQLSKTQQLSIYPNPATDVLNLLWSQPSNAEVSVVDLTGNVISTLATNGDYTTTVNIHDLAAGNYVLRITNTTSKEQKSILFSKF
jgi:PKD repeat protein